MKLSAKMVKRNKENLLVSPDVESVVVCYRFGLPIVITSIMVCYREVIAISIRVR